MSVTFQQELPIYKEVDVLVAGGVLNCVVKDKEERTWR